MAHAADHAADGAGLRAGFRGEGVGREEGLAVPVSDSDGGGRAVLSSGQEAGRGFSRAGVSVSGGWGETAPERGEGQPGPGRRGGPPRKGAGGQGLGSVAAAPRPLSFLPREAGRGAVPSAGWGGGPGGGPAGLGASPAEMPFLTAFLAASHRHGLRC